MQSNADIESRKGAIFRRRLIGMLVLASLVFVGGGTADARDLLIFAAASTADALNAAIAEFTRETGLTVRVSYASSGALARQIDYGAPAAVFISANVAWVAWLNERARLAPHSRVPLFGNRLVLIEPASERPAAPKGPKNLIPHMFREVPDIATRIKGLQQGKLAIANPDHVPAGAYAKEALTAMGLWKTASASAVWTRDVKAALLLVERREAALGIVYKSLVLGDDKVRVVDSFPSETHRPIRYHMAIVEEQDSPTVRRLYAYLQSLPAKAVFGRYGFDTKKYHGPVKSR